MCLSPSVTCKGPVIDYGEEGVLQNKGGGGASQVLPPKSRVLQHKQGVTEKSCSHDRGGGGGGGGGGGHNRFGGSFIMGT